MHVGKSYPRLIPGWYDLGIPGGYGPSRKVQIICTTPALGSLAGEWAAIGSSGASALGVVDPSDGGKQTYLLQSSVNPDSQMRIERTFTGPHATPLSGWRYRILTRCTQVYLGTDMAWFESEASVPQGYDIYQVTDGFTAWNDLVDPSLFFRLNVTVRSAVWSLQPEYHPYRH